MCGVVKCTKCDCYGLSNQNLGGRNVSPGVYNSIFIIVDWYGSTVSKDDMFWTGTPSFFLIGPENEIVKIHGAQPYSTFKQTFDSQLEK